MSKKADTRDKECPGCSKIIMRKSKSCRSCWQLNESGVPARDVNGYYKVHQWLYRTYKKTGVCDFCLNKTKTEWANKDGTYKKDINSWLELCRQCHRDYDRWRYLYG